MSIKFFFLFELFFSFACTTSKNISQPIEGHAVLKERFVDYQTKIESNPLGTKERNYWVYDSSVILENLHIYFSNTANGSKSQELVIDNYTFVDFRTETFYIISSFSDTATVQDRFDYRSTNERRVGNFFLNISQFFNEEYVFIADTTIKTTHYKRIRGIAKLDSINSYTIIGYLNCDLKRSLLLSEQVLSRKLNCPILRTDHLNSSGSLVHFSEYEYLSLRLTDQERSAFLSIREKIKNFNK
jgi:hypothetical protein